MGSIGAASTSATGSTAGGQVIAQSGVQHPIFSCSGAMPISAPAMEHPAEGAAKAGPGVIASESATSKARMSLIKVRQCSRARFESMGVTGCAAPL